MSIPSTCQENVSINSSFIDMFLLYVDTIDRSEKHVDILAIYQHIFLNSISYIYLIQLLESPTNNLASVILVYENLPLKKS